MVTDFCPDRERRRGQQTALPPGLASPYLYKIDMKPLLLGDLDNRGIVLQAICHDPGLEIQMCVHWTYTGRPRQDDVRC